MRKTVSFFFCVLWAFYSSATSVSISETAITPENAGKQGFHRLIDGGSDTWNDSWIIFIYPETDSNGRKASEICLDVYKSSEKLASSCAEMKASEVKGFNRLDIEVSEHRDVFIDISITYGSERYVVKNVASLPGKDYESFKRRYHN